MGTWFSVFGIVAVIIIIATCVWYGNAVTEHGTKGNKVNKLQYLRQNPLIFALFLCLNTGTSMDGKRIYDDDFQYEKIGF